MRLIGATASGGGWPGNVSGTITIHVSWAPAQTQLQTASSLLAGLTANQTLGNVNSGLSIGLGLLAPAKRKFLA